MWGFWWMAHQVTHLGDPWFTRSIAAPAGTELGYHALMPLEGLVLAPVTLGVRPRVFSDKRVRSVPLPGLCCYAMYRAARLWLRTPAGAVAAGGLFGLSSMVDLAGLVSAQPGRGRAVLAAGPGGRGAAAPTPGPPGRRCCWAWCWPAATDQETAVLTGILVVLALAPWLAGRPRRDAVSGDPAGGGAPTRTRKLAVTAAAVAVALAAASPQIVAMVVQSRSGGASYPPHAVAAAYGRYSANLRWMFGVSPRAVGLGLTALKPVSYPSVVNGGQALNDGIPAFGLVLSVLAVAGLIVSRRRRSAWLLALLWAGAAALALGSTLKIGSHVSTCPPPRPGTACGSRRSCPTPGSFRTGLAGFARPPGSRCWPSRPPRCWPALPSTLLARPRPRPARRPGRTRPWPRPSMPVPRHRHHGPPRWPALDRRPSPPTPPPPSSSTSRSASAAASRCPARAPRSTPRPRCWPPPTATPALVGLPVPDPARHAGRHPLGTRSTPGCWAAQANQTRPAAAHPARTPGYPALLAAARRDARAMHIGWILLWQHTPAITRYLTRHRLPPRLHRRPGTRIPARGALTGLRGQACGPGRRPRRAPVYARRRGRWRSHRSPGILRPRWLARATRGRIRPWARAGG